MGGGGGGGGGGFLTHFFYTLAPGSCGSNFKTTGSSGIDCEITLMGMPQNLANEKSDLVQLMACCS